MRSTIPFFALAFAVSAAVACKKEPTTPPQGTGSAVGSATPSASAPAPEAPAVWTKDLTKEQKGAIMKQRVTPAQGEVFKAYDAAKYASFGCKTCHGPDFKDPDDFLPALTMKDGKLTSFTEKPEISKFMHEKVVPNMAKAMGVPEYDPATKQGFGCAGCHKIDMK